MNNNMAITTYLSAITLNVNGLNAVAPTVAEWITSQDRYICLKLASDQKTQRLKVKRYKKRFRENGNKNKSQSMAM